MNMRVTVLRSSRRRLTSLAALLALSVAGATFGIRAASTSGTQDDTAPSPAAHATPDGVEIERLYLAEQEHVQSVMRDVRPELEKDPGFAGTWLDVEAGWIVNIATTGDPAAVEEVLAAFEDRDIAFRVRKVDYTLAELRMLQEEVRQDHDMWRDQGVTITSIGVDIEANRLAIGVPDLSPEAANSLQSAYGDRVTTHAEGLATAGVMPVPAP
jgi:hypothetical protein